MIKKIFLYSMIVCMSAFSSCEKDIDTNGKIIKNLDFSITTPIKTSYVNTEKVVFATDISDNDGIRFAVATIYDNDYNDLAEDYLVPGDNFSTSFLTTKSDVPTSDTHKTPYKSYSFKSTLPLSGLPKGDYIYELFIRKRVNNINKSRFEYFRFKIN